MVHDLNYILRCFELAEKCRGMTKSNPLVGAIFVYEDQIISEGFHSEYGGPHAEIHCLESILDEKILSNGTLYTSLEPCSHQNKKTPPCTDFILQKGIRKVVIGSKDPNPEVNGQGIEFLKNHNLDVLDLNLNDQQILVNKKYIVNQIEKRPYFIGKLAVSLNNCIGKKGEEIKITSKEIDTLAHKLRLEVDAILVGKNSWEIDQPRLDIRHIYSESNPDILIISSKMINFKEYKDLNRKIININNSEDAQISSNIQAIKTDIYNAEKLSEAIFKLGYKSILVEGGGEVMDFFIKNKLLDEFYLIQNEELIIQNGINLPSLNLGQLSLHSETSYLNHTISIYKSKLNQ